MPLTAANNPANCCGKASAQPGTTMNNSHTPIPSTTAATAPWVVARFQYKPNTSGVKAPTSGTWYAPETIS